MWLVYTPPAARASASARDSYSPSVPVISCTTDEPDRVMSVLGSDQALQWVRHHAAGSGLGVGTVRLSPRLLAAIPLR